MHTTSSRWSTLAALTALVAASLACNAVGNAITNNPAVATVQAVTTQAGQLNDLALTAEALATQANVGDLAGTAEALATQANAGDLAATAEALATETGSVLATTPEAPATSMVPGLGNAPADIPVVPGETTNYLATQDMVTYGTSLPLSDVLDFYKKEMKKNDWQAQEDKFVEMADAVFLQYDKDQRTATIALTKDPATGQTVVVVAIQAK